MNAPVLPGLATTEALVTVGRWLQATAYHFTTVTPATQARVNARADAQLAQDLRGVFGWSRAFAPELLPGAILDTLRQAGLLALADAGRLRSKVRYSSLRGGLYAHSAWPTAEEDAVFFGPDTCRFTDLIASELARQPLVPGRARLLDLGCGSGAGGLVAAELSRGAGPTLVLADINARALQFAAANAALARCGDLELAQGDLFAAVQGAFDLVVANPPYLNDPAGRTYRHGGGRWGGGLSERIVREGLPRLAPGGRLVLYTGAAMVEGADPLLHALGPVLSSQGWPWTYRELDPDVFGEELLEPAYAHAERIAAVALVVQRPT